MHLHHLQEVLNLYFADALKHVGVLKINEVFLVYIFIYIYIYICCAFVGSG